MSSTPDWHPMDLFLISVCASWRMKMNSAERVYEFPCCSGHPTCSDVSKGAKRAPFLRDCLRRDARRRGRRFSHVLPPRPQRCGTTRYAAECFLGLRPWRTDDLLDGAFRIAVCPCDDGQSPSAHEAGNGCHRALCGHCSHRGNHGSAADPLRGSAFVPTLWAVSISYPSAG